MLNIYTSEQLQLGQSFTISRSCNPNFIMYLRGPWHPARQNCEDIGRGGYCDPNLLNWGPRAFITYGNYNEHNLFETPLQCPQCGCGAEGAVNLNDLYAAEETGSNK